MMFAAMLKDAWRQTRDQWIQWVLYAAIVLLLIGLIFFPIDWLSELLLPAKKTSMLLSDDERHNLVWTLLKSLTTNWVGRLFGVTIAIVMTAGQLPAMLRPGGIDLIASFPHARWKLLLAKYAGGVVFVAWYATLLIGGIYVVSGIRGGGWDARFLLCIPILLLFYSTMYSVSLLMAVLFRNVVMVILGTMALWLVAWLIGTLGNGFYEVASVNYRHAQSASYQQMAAENKQSVMLIRMMQEQERQQAEQEAKDKGQPPPPPPPGKELQEEKFKEMTRDQIFAEGEFWEHLADGVRIPSYFLPKLDLFDQMCSDLSFNAEVKNNLTTKLETLFKKMAETPEAKAATPDEIDTKVAERLKQVNRKEFADYTRDGLITGGFIAMMLILSCWIFSRTDY